MDTHFICLANSYKRGGRCVAGVEIEIDANDRWTVKRKADGNPIWIRPISKDTEYGEIPESEAYHVPLMSVVRLTAVEPCPSESHTEDVNYGSMIAIGKVPSCHEVLRELTVIVHTTLFYSIEFSISIETYVQGDYSLMMVHPEGFSFRLDPTKNRAKYYMIFQYNGVTYDFSITDPAFYQYINQYPEALDKLSDVYLALSLGLEYEQRHHKLIAAVLIPEMGTVPKDPFIVRRNTLREKTTRQFTSSEYSNCRKCFIVPSQQGFAACMKMRDGQEEFMDIDDDCQVEAWQKVNLKKAQMVIYEDADGNEVKKMRIPNTAMRFSASHLLTFWGKLFPIRRWKRKMRIT